jgi:hypothetical protein
LGLWRPKLRNSQKFPGISWNDVFPKEPSQYLEKMTTLVSGVHTYIAGVLEVPEHPRNMEVQKRGQKEM